MRFSICRLPGLPVSQEVFQYIGRESNPQKAGFEPAAYANSATDVYTVKSSYFLLRGDTTTTILYERS